MGLLAVFVATFFVFRNSGRKVLRLVGAANFFSFHNLFEKFAWRGRSR